MMKKVGDKNTKNFHYYNVNPMKKKTGDCVIRAIACALDVDWEVASDMLYKNAKQNYCEMSELQCYSKMLNQLPFLKQVETDCQFVDEFARQNPKGTYLIRIEGHLTCLKDGICYDIWDCTNEGVDKIWSVL